MRSHPMWVRGLKQIVGLPLVCCHQSHPMWVRGLKQQPIKANVNDASRTLCGCVD